MLSFIPKLFPKDDAEPSVADICASLRRQDFRDYVAGSGRTALIAHHVKNDNARRDLPLKGA